MCKAIAGPTLYSRYRHTFGTKFGIPKILFHKTKYQTNSRQRTKDPILGYVVISLHGNYASSDYGYVITDRRLRYSMRSEAWSRRYV